MLRLEEGSVFWSMMLGMVSSLIGLVGLYLMSNKVTFMLEISLLSNSSCSMYFLY